MLGIDCIVLLVGTNDGPSSQWVRCYATLANVCAKFNNMHANARLCVCAVIISGYVWLCCVFVVV